MSPSQAAVSLTQRPRYSVDPTQPIGPGNLPMHQQFYISANTVTAEPWRSLPPGTVAAGAGPAYMFLFRA